MNYSGAFGFIAVLILIRLFCIACEGARAQEAGDKERNKEMSKKFVISLWFFVIAGTLCFLTWGVT